MGTNDAKYAYYGKSMLIAGIERSLEIAKAEKVKADYVIDALQAELDSIRATLAGHLEPVPGKIGRPRKFKQREPGKLPSGWPADPEERRREMKRRMARRGKVSAKKSSIEQTVARMSKSAKASWARMSPRKRKERLAKMAAGRAAKKQLPTVALAVAS